MNIKAAIFDLDGTIVDSFNAWHSIFNEAFLKMNCKLTDEIFQEMYRMTGHDTIYFLHKTYLQNIDNCTLSFSDIMKTLDDNIRFAYGKTIQAKPYALNFLDMISDNEINICVATLTPSHLASLVLKRLGIMDHISFIITGDEVGHSKRTPEIYLESAKRLGVSPKETIVFEDSLTAAKTAKNAGFNLCGVYDQYQHYPFEEMEKISSFTIRDYEEAIMLFEDKFFNQIDFTCCV